METPITWVTDPYHPQNKARNQALVEFLVARTSLKPVVSRLSLGVYRFTAYPKLTEEERHAVQQQVDELQYEPLTIAIALVDPIERTSYELFLSRLVRAVTGVEVADVVAVTYEDHIELSPLTGQTDLGLLDPIYVRPTELGDYRLRLDPSPFQGSKYLADTPLLWLALSELDAGLLQNYTFREKEGVVGFASIDSEVDPLFLRQVRNKLEGYRARQLQWHRVDVLNPEDADLLEEWARLWRVNVVARFPYGSRYLFYEAPTSPHFAWDYCEVLADLRQGQLPIIAVTGDWAQTIEPLPINRVLMKYAALKALTQLIEANAVLALGLTELEVLPDLTILVRLGALNEAEAFHRLFRGHLQQARTWVYQSVANAEVGLRLRRKILETSEHLVPLVIPLEHELYLVVDSTDDYDIPTVTETEPGAPVSRDPYQLYGYYALPGVMPGLIPALEALSFPAPAPDSSRIEVTSLTPELQVVTAVLPERTEILFDIATSEVQRVERAAVRLWYQGFFLTAWAQTYYLYTQRFSRDLLRQDLVLAAAGSSLERGAIALAYLEQ